MPLFRRVRVIRTRRELPGWLEAFRWTVTGATALALCLVIAESGYRIPLPPATGWLVGLFKNLVLVLFAADIILGYAFAPSRWRYFKQRWPDAVLLVAAVISFFVSRSHLPFIVARQFLVVGQAFTRSSRFAGIMDRIRLQPVRLLAISFLVLIGVGTLLLTFPAATASGTGTPLLDAVFTATSATCVTGLIVRDTPVYFSRFGQLVVLVLLQLGGLGIMTFSASLAVVFGRKLGLGQRKAVSTIMEEARDIDIARTLRYILLLTLVAEGVGTLLLFARWLPEARDAGEALYQAGFHSISAFCNAGFSVFSDSLARYGSDPVVNVVVIMLVVGGGLGFVVVRELVNRDTVRQGPVFALKRLSVHGRLVLWTSGILLVGAAVFFFFFEYDHSLAPLRLGGKLLASVFQAVTPRTAGFNTVPISSLRPVTLFIWTMLMFVGASPGGTGGGIKTTTLAVLVLAVRNRIRGRDEVELGRRVIPKDIVYRASAIAAVSVGIVALFFSLMLIAEKAPFQNVLFETVSAFGTVGLTTGMTPVLSPFGKIAITLLMYIGRLGPLTLALAMRTRRSRLPISYPDARIMVG